MLHFTRILHPTDFSDASTAALRQAAHWSRLCEAELHVVHACAALDAYAAEEVTEAPAPWNADEAPHLALAQQMREQTAKAGADDRPVRYFLVHGVNCADALIAHARTTAADLIVLGHHGVGTAQAGDLGRVAVAMMQRATCPVLLVPHQPGDYRSTVVLRRLLVYFNLRQPVCELIELASALAVRFTLLLDLVHVTPPSDAPVREPLSPNLKERLFDLCAQVRAQEAPVPSLPLEVHLHTRTGDPAEVLAQMVQERAADLLLMVAPSVAPTEYAPSEAEAERIVRQAPCPALLVTPSGASPRRAAAREAHVTTSNGTAATAPQG